MQIDGSNLCILSSVLPRQTTDVVPMKMRKADGINRVEAPAAFPNRHLRSFPTVNQQGTAV